MKRTQLNFGIDAAAFVGFMLLLATGLLLEYQLPAGSGGLQGRGSGRGTGEQQIALLWGWTRHDWGQIHYWIAVVCMAVLALHLVLHWKWILAVVKGAHDDASGYRCAVGLASLIGVVLLCAMPLVVSTQQVSRHELAGEQGSAETDASLDEHTVRGSMTVSEVAVALDRPVDKLLKDLGLPASTEPSDRMGQVLRRNGREMSDVHRLHGTAER